MILKIHPMAEVELKILAKRLGKTPEELLESLAHIIAGISISRTIKPEKLHEILVNTVLKRFSKLT